MLEKSKEFEQREQWFLFYVLASLKTSKKVKSFLHYNKII